MRKFQDAYREAVDGLPMRRLTAEELLNGPPERSRGGQNIWIKGAAAAAVLLLCSVSTVTAVNYHKSRISIEQQGYSLTSVAEDNGEAADTGGEAGNGAFGNVESGNEATPRMAAYSPEEGGADDEGYFVETIEEQREYSSVEDFRQAEQITMALPEPQWLGEEEAVWQIYVMGEGDSVTAMLFGGDERSFMMHQWDTRGLAGYASSTAYTGESANERNLTNSQGLTYVVFDSVEGGEIISTHAVISANGRELCMDFQGYDGAVIERVLSTLDLSVYYAD